jgi:AAHS family 4-hydroxybenzoate transporter-like MFS transporter
MQTVDVSAVIDRAPVGAFQKLTMAICGLVVFLDGFDAQVIGPVAPAIAKAWGVAVASFGLAFSAGLAGLMCGALVFGPVADRYGRKKVLVASTLIFALGSLSTMAASGVGSLILWRFLTGIGLGGAMPNTIALTAEYAPARLRGLLVSIMFIGFPLGGFVGGLAAAPLVASFGWPGVFAAGGLLPLAVVPLLIWVLPESIRFLAARKEAGARVAATLRRIDPALSLAAETRFHLPEEPLSGLPVRHLLSEGRGAGTVLLWVAFFMNLLVIYFVLNWLPAMLQGAGLSFERATRVAALFSFGGMIGGVAIGRLGDRGNPFVPIAAAFLAGAVSLAAIGSSGTSLVPLIAAILVGGFAIPGAQFAMNALAAAVYPTAVRSTGVSWALGIGRLGAIVGPFIGGELLRFAVGAQQIFFLAALPALIACAAILALRQTKLARAGQPAVALAAPARAAQF